MSTDFAYGLPRRRLRAHAWASSEAIRRGRRRGAVSFIGRPLLDRGLGGSGNDFGRRPAFRRDLAGRGDERADRLPFVPREAMRRMHGYFSHAATLANALIAIVTVRAARHGRRRFRPFVA